ncbi:sulfite exporter TauE/SafE family protein [Methylotenera sp.]|uniref:sulfite exporter TauE/SafE family protein n=1 Tax=Methylotenera sp. TaxID=2051956 RepID=UPI002487437D|nr:sulfite exporter TauE/SafE family protein [Methylotenera sp.]MDI1360498.1 sulfite exporter TauE/SafE family protein [Methylotenera sp.]
MILILGLGLFVGLVMGLTGAGGGIIALPLLVFLLNISIVDATPIALLAVACSASLGAIIGLHHQTVRYKAAVLMAIAGSLVSPLGVLVAHKIDNHYLLAMFALILIFVAYKTVKSQNSEIDTSLQDTLPCALNPQTGRFIWTSRCSISIMVSGAVAGFLSGLLGVGGGFVIVPALQRFTTLSIHAVIGTSLAVIALISTSVVVSSIYHLDMDWNMAIQFACGSMAGIVIGKALLTKIEVNILKYGFAVLTILVALMMLTKLFNY